MELTYLGTAMLALDCDGTRLLTDPVLDPIGTTYNLGPAFVPRAWFATEKTYASPPLAPGRFDAVLLSHDHHADNLDGAGRALIADASRVDRVLTTVPSAKRLAVQGRARGLAAGQTMRVGNVTVRAMPALHGPRFVPQADEVVGFLLDIDHGPRIWISGDTVMFPALRAAMVEIAKERPVDVAVVHCGAVRFPKVPLLSRARFTFDAAEAVEACKLVAAKRIVPIHRTGWTHFQEAESVLFHAFEGMNVTRLEPGASLTL